MLSMLLPLPLQLAGMRQLQQWPQLPRHLVAQLLPQLPSQLPKPLQPPLLPEPLLSP
jgi:hypothetical protein